jgi:copper chaperone CopZ
MPAQNSWLWAACGSKAASGAQRRNLRRERLMIVEYLFVPGISSANDIRTISAALSAAPGVQLVSVSLADKRVRVEHDARASVEELIRAINQAGFQQVALLV